ncbi:MAG: hypothetical protein HOB73_06910 [Planctomycetaceae bacterium]|nr:hypothetical protein [Planctomycetaceae bacterium]
MRLQLNNICCWAFVACLVAFAGCSQWRFPKIDPSGARLFQPDQSTTIAHPFRDTEQVGSFPNPFPKPAFEKPAPPASFADSGNRLNSQQAQSATENQTRPGSLWISSKIIAAPVGSAVVLKAGLRGREGKLRTGRKLEWTIAPKPEGSQAKFEAAGGGNPNGFRWLFPKYGNQVTDTYAHTISSERAELVHNDTTTIMDDVTVSRGESWITISAEQVGTTKILVGASTETEWDKQYRDIHVHWIDVQWKFPASLSIPNGTQPLLTTSVMRKSDNTPLPDYIVRYRIIGNRQATLSTAQNNEQLDSIDVPSDQLGQATVRVTSNQTQAGSVQVLMEIIRPANAAQQTPDMVIGGSSAHVTWNAPALKISATGPTTTEIGKPIRLQVSVTNPGNQTATNVTMTQTLPFAVNVESSNPIANIIGRQATWKLGDITPRTQKKITVEYQANEVGAIDQVLAVTCQEGLEASTQTVTKIIQSLLEIQITGPKTASLNEIVEYQILMHNRSNRAIERVQLVQTLGPGFIHVSRTNPQGNPTVRKVGFQATNIQPGQTMVKKLSLQITQSGRLCHQLRATLATGLIINKETCVQVAPNTGTSNDSPKAAKDSLVVAMKGPLQFTDNSTNTHRFRITNQSNSPITNITINVLLPASMESQLASEGHSRQDQSIILDVSTLAPAQSRTLVIQSLATQESDNETIQLRVIGDGIEAVKKKIAIQITAAQETNPLDLSPDDIEPSDENPQRDPPPNLDNLDQPVIPAEPAVAPPELQLKLAVLNEPIENGSPNTFFLYLQNTGKSDASNIEIKVSAPTGMIITAIEHSTATAQQLDESIAKDQLSATLPVIKSLKSNQKVIPYKIHIKTVATGVHKLNVAVSATGLVAPITASDTTRILAPN